MTDGPPVKGPRGPAPPKEGRENNLLDLLAADQRFAGIDIRRIVDPKRFIGRAPEQVAAFNRDYVVPIRRRFKKAIGASAALEV